MSFLKVTALASAACLAAFLGYKYMITADPPGYCSAQQRYISDEEFIKLAVKLREDDIARHGGLSAYEKELIRQKNNPDNAGRDFDINNPNCCRVFRGGKQVERNCGWGDYSPPLILSLLVR